MTRTIDSRIENNRQAYLEALYILDGRDKPNHPHHATYTGLYLQRIEQLLTADSQQLTTATQAPITTVLAAAA